MVSLSTWPGRGGTRRICMTESRNHEKFWELQGKQRKRQHQTGRNKCSYHLTAADQDCSGRELGRRKRRSSHAD